MVSGEMEAAKLLFTFFFNFKTGLNIHRSLPFILLRNYLLTTDASLNIQSYIFALYIYVCVYVCVWYCVCVLYKGQTVGLKRYHESTPLMAIKHDILIWW